MSATVGRGLVPDQAAAHVVDQATAPAPAAPAPAAPAPAAPAAPAPAAPAPAAPALRIALKEWALVCDLLVAGQQIALLRKGGIHEPRTAPHRDGFALEHDTFLLYPNVEHQKTELVQPRYHHLLAGHAPSPRADGEVVIPGYCRVTDAIQLRDPAHVHALAAQTCWTAPFFEQRLAYKPDRPTLLVLVRAYRFPAPLRLPYHKLYAGCRSWVPLRDTVDASVIAAAAPALDGPAFAAARRATLDSVGVVGAAGAAGEPVAPAPYR